MQRLCDTETQKVNAKILCNTNSFFLSHFSVQCLSPTGSYSIKKIKCDYGGQRSEEGNLSHKVLLTRGQNKLPALICGAGTNVLVSSLKIIMEVCC